MKPAAAELLAGKEERRNGVNENHSDRPAARHGAEPE
jgi:hypothetical protein